MTGSGPAAVGSKWKECMNEEVTTLTKGGGPTSPIEPAHYCRRAGRKRDERKAKQKTLFRQREKSLLLNKREARQIQAPQIPSPSLAGQTETLIRQFSWLQIIAPRRLPMLAHSGFSSSRSLSQWRDRAGFQPASLLSLATPNPNDMNF